MLNKDLSVKPLKRPLYKNKNDKIKKEKKMQQEEEIKERNHLIEQIKQLEFPIGDSFFNDYPFSTKTKRGLEACSIKKPTPIQIQGIFDGLKGNDIFGTAKTGSGKTLAFLIPLIECLWQDQWTHYDGLGAMVISPTRELAYQTFNVLRDVGKFHNFSAGLIIGGGKDIEGEKEHIKNTCILICTPGRLLQHMNENPYLDVSHLKLLVLDEADRILDMGFKKEMLAILDFLPSNRQTMLYSATQDDKVMELARACLKRNPKFIHTNHNDEYSTPTQLAQSFLICELHQKMNFMHKFLKNHSKSKLIIFVSCCKQAKYLSECFKKLRVGLPVISLHGGQKQIRRLESFETFCSNNACALFATDLASRGLDFPSVDWVVQLDCPSDANTYIHRVGRTARLNKDGKALLVLMPSELKLLNHLKSNKIPIYQTYYKDDNSDITKKLQSFCIKDKEFMQSGKRCVLAYKKTISIQSDKQVFQPSKLDYNKYAISLGLSAFDMCLKYNNNDDTTLSLDTTTNKTTTDINNIVSKLEQDENMDDDDDDEFLVKSTNQSILSIQQEDSQLNFGIDRTKQRTKIGIAKRLLKKGITVNTKIKFDDLSDENSKEEGRGLNLIEANIQLKQEDNMDRKNERERIRLKHKSQKERTKHVEYDNESLENSSNTD